MCQTDVDMMECWFPVVQGVRLRPLLNGASEVILGHVGVARDRIWTVFFYAYRGDMVSHHVALGLSGSAL